MKVFVSPAMNAVEGETFESTCIDILNNVNFVFMHLDIYIVFLHTSV